MGERRAPVMSKSLMVGATERAAARVLDLKRLLAAIEGDTGLAARLDRHECKACFYFSRIGGQAITQQACMSCGAMQVYGSTNTDVLCLMCALKGDLCKHCGGDLDMRPRRRKWPTAYTEKEKS